MVIFLLYSQHPAMIDQIQKIEENLCLWAHKIAAALMIVAGIISWYFKISCSARSLLFP